MQYSFNFVKYFPCSILEHLETFTTKRAQTSAILKNRVGESNYKGVAHNIFTKNIPKGTLPKQKKVLPLHR